MRFMNERHGRILRFLKPYIKTIYIKIGKYWIKIPITIKKKKNSTIQIYCQQTLLLYTFELIFRRTSLLLPLRFDELPGSRNGQGSSALSRREHARDSGPITLLAHYRCRLWNGRCAVRNAHAVHTRPRAHTRPCPFTQKGKAAESG